MNAQSTGDVPNITGSMYSSNAIDTGNICAGWGNVASGNAAIVGGGNQALQRFLTCLNPFEQIDRQPEQQIETPMANTVNRRIVQVFIADPNDNVPLESSVLYKGDQKLTDLNDTELFFEVSIAEILNAHNKGRVKWTDKDASKKAGKDVFLDAAKIRDLKMVVVTIATF